MSSTTDIPPIGFKGLGLTWQQRFARGEQTKDLPWFSMAPSGRRFFWTLWPANSSGWNRDEDDPALLASGYAESRLAAWTQIQAWVGLRVINAGPRNAQRILHERNVEKRSKRRTTSTTAQRLEYIFRVGDNPDFDDFSHTPHRVVKKTARYVFVTQNTRTTSEWDVPTYRLDRATLERDGELWHDWARWVLDAEAHRRRVGRLATPDYLHVLGLEAHATRKDIQRAYRRLSKQLHPDAGGDNAAFIRLQQAYEIAIRGVSQGSVS